VFGGKAGFLQQFASGGFGAAFIRIARFVSNDSCGKLNGARVDGNAVLLHQQDFLLRRHADDDGRTGGIDPVNVFPMAFFDQSQELAGVQDCLFGLLHFFSKG
jgi:hypothetical protein